MLLLVAVFGDIVKGANLVGKKRKKVFVIRGGLFLVGKERFFLLRRGKAREQRGTRGKNG